MIDGQINHKGEVIKYRTVNASELHPNSKAAPLDGMIADVDPSEPIAESVRLPKRRDLTLSLDFS